MTLEKIFELLMDEREKSAEFREKVLERLAVLETKESGSKDGWRVVGWVLTFLISVAAFGVSVSTK